VSGPLVPTWWVPGCALVLPGRVWLSAMGLVVPD